MNYSAWSNAFGAAWGDSWGLVVTVVTQSSDRYGGDYHARVARDFAELRQIIEQIEREDEEILAVLVTALQSGVLQ